ncbi:MAG: hypothetical protein EKK45_10835 [Curvibacter sp.]|nr:MAG: hypothetical protein EKK45_10835 [Curvibacter sp.]
MRQIQALGQEHELHVLGFGPRPTGVHAFEAVRQVEGGTWSSAANAVLLAARCHRWYYWRHAQVRALLHAAQRLPANSFDLVLANDVMTLPAALKLARGAPVWLDAHEYAPREFEDRTAWRLLLGPFFDAVCRSELGRVARMSTVCDGIAQEYAMRYGLPVAVMPNCPEPMDLPVRPVADGSIRMIHHGAAIASRRIEVMIDLVRHLDQRFSLDLMLLEQDPAYMASLRRRAQNQPRIRFVEPVAMSEIATRTNGYDIGLFLLPPVNFNYLHALPNKFFEFMQARLAIAIGPSPQMQALVDAHGCGVVAPGFEPVDLAGVLNALSREQIQAMKQASDRAATHWNAEVTRAWLLAEVNALLEDRRPYADAASTNQGS